MKKILVVFAKEGDFNINFQFNRQISKSNCPNSSALFVNGYINYGIWKRENDYILITVRFKDTIFNKKKIKNIDETLGKAIESFVRCIVTQECISENFEYIVIVHEIQLCPSEEFKITSYSIGGGGAPKERGDILKEIFSQNKLKDGYEEIKKNFITEEDKKRGALFTFSILKHQITDLLLPLDMNLQGIYEISKKSKEKAVEHLKDILKNKNKNPAFYRQKLADLQFMVAKVKGVGGTLLTENDLPDNKSILDLLPDLLPEDKTIVKEEWEMLLKLSGLGLKENRNNLFNREDLEVKVDSGIFVFMKLLDDKIGKYCKDEKSININDVNEILDAEPLKKLLEEIGLHSFSLNPFSHWYNFLNSYLDKLREKIVKEEEKSRKIG